MEKGMCQREFLCIREKSSLSKSWNAVEHKWNLAQKTCIQQRQWTIYALFFFLILVKYIARHASIIASLGLWCPFWYCSPSIHCLYNVIGHTGAGSIIFLLVWNSQYRLLINKERLYMNEYCICFTIHAQYWWWKNPMDIT